jgi:predicted nucleic acid-binding protein
MTTSANVRQGRVDVLVDTPIWSLTLRRQESAKLSAAEIRCKRELAELLAENRARIIGPVRQEILSAVRHRAQFERLRTLLRQFDCEPLSTADFESAAEAGNMCREKGLAGSPVDYLICAVALSRRWAVFTLDRDFDRFARVLGVPLHAPRNINPLH